MDVNIVGENQADARSSGGKYHSTRNRPQPHRIIYSGLPDSLINRHDAAEDREFTGSFGFGLRGTVGVRWRKGERRSEFTPSCGRVVDSLFVEYMSERSDGSRYIERVSLLEPPSPTSYLVKGLNPSQRYEMMETIAARHQVRRSLERDSDTRDKRVAGSLTPRGKSRIHDGIALLSFRYGQRSLGFYTLTCPYTDSDDIQRFNDNLPEIARRFFQQMKRLYAKKGFVFSYVSVYEIQPGRFKATGDECLHIHYIAPALDPERRFHISHSEILSLYTHYIEQVLGTSPPHSPRVDAQLVRKDASAYLAKYFSKASLTDSSALPTGANARLSSWYSLSRNLLRAISHSRFELPGHIASLLFAESRYSTSNEMCDRIRPIFRVIDGISRHVGCFFSIRPEWLGSLREQKFAEVAHLL